MIVASVADPLQHRRGQLGIAVEGRELADDAAANRVRGDLDRLLVLGDCGDVRRPERRLSIAELFGTDRLHAAGREQQPVRDGGREHAADRWLPIQSKCSVQRWREGDACRAAGWDRIMIEPSTTIAAGRDAWQRLRERERATWDFFDLDQGSVSTLGTYRAEAGHGYDGAADSRDRGR